MNAPTAMAQPRGDDRIVVGGLLAVGLYLVAVSLLMLISPAPFYEEVGPFNGRSDHYIRDGATFQLAFGELAPTRSRRPAAPAHSRGSLAAPDAERPG